MTTPAQIIDSHDITSLRQELAELRSEYKLAGGTNAPLHTRSVLWRNIKRLEAKVKHAEHLKIFEGE